MAVLPSVLPAQSLPSRQADSLSCVVAEFDRERFPPRDSWLRLFESAAHARASHHPDYVQAVFPDLGIPGWTVTCRRGAEPVAMAVLVPKRCRLGRPVLPGASSSLVGLRLAGFGLLGADDTDVVNKLVNTLAAELQARGIRIIEFEELQADSLLWASLQTLRTQGFRFAPTDSFDAHHHIHLPPTAEEYWKTFNSKHRYRMRKEREGLGEYTVRRYTQVSEVDDWLTAAHEISQKSWQSHQLGLRIKNSDQECAFLTFLASMGAWRSYVLFRDEQPVAFALGHQWRQVFHYDEVGFDRTLVKQFPGKVLLQEVLTDLMSHDRPETFDFGLGDADYKQFFANEHSRSATLWMFPPGIRSCVQAASIHGRRKAGRLARELIGKTGWYESIRSTLRNTAAK